LSDAPTSEITKDDFWVSINRLPLIAAHQWFPFMDCEMLRISFLFLYKWTHKF
jgi:hypothetical protein